MRSEDSGKGGCNVKLDEVGGSCRASGFYAGRLRRPVFLRLGPPEFRWYGLMYILVFIAVYFIILSGVRRKRLTLNKDQVAELVFTEAIGVILGGRLGYWCFCG